MGNHWREAEAKEQGGPKWGQALRSKEPQFACVRPSWHFAPCDQLLEALEDKCPLLLGALEVL